MHFDQAIEETEAQALFAEVILPLPLPQLFTYRVPVSMEAHVKPGIRVMVQFGPKRVITAVVFRLHHQAPKQYEVKTILDVLDESPVVSAQQFQLWNWVAEYYMCTVGEVLQAALPSGLKLSSESYLQRNPDYQGSYEFTEEEKFILEELDKHSISYAQAAQLLNKKSILPIIKSLIRKDVILVFEQVKEKYNPKTIRKVRLTEKYRDSTSLEYLLETLASKVKQQEVVLAYLSLCPLSSQEMQLAGIPKNLVIEKGVSASSLQTLIRAEVMEEYLEVISRFHEIPSNQEQGFELSSLQQEKKEEILNHFAEDKVVLLHGITGSGKTEIYMDLIRQALQGGSQVLLLLPEIALTSQMVHRFRKEFGSTLGVYHSRYSDNERVEVWRSVISGKYSFIIGVRSSVFLPFDNLGLIIVDEEHESSYKQYEPAPRYHARDTAIMLAGFHHAKVLLGSATPSLESMTNAAQGRWAKVELLQRYGNAQLPLIELIDLRKERKNKSMQLDFPERLLEQIRNRVEQQEQVILFQNRRGYSPYLSCQLCGFVPTCEHCSVSLTYHMRSGELRCHYCGYNRKTPKQCPACGSTKISTVGFGTEKLEDDLTTLMRDIRVQRMDLDTTRQKNSYNSILEDFQSGNTQVLVGTQMVTKGLDFDHVTLVSVFDIDRMLFFPDFRSLEKTFQVLVQVSGRAGRRGKRGLVSIQTSKPESPVFQWVMNMDFKSFYTYEWEERKRFAYPPFVRLLLLTVKDPDERLAEEMSELLASALRKELGTSRVLGPEAPVINRVRNQYLMQVMIKLEKDKVNIPMVKKFVAKTIQVLLQREKKFKKTSILCDVDPV
ncbi:MAG: primosomal protein N' [Cytophagaceae bacterium]|jgi:primosomal protein N' (replication factor Y)|nr:primosomal protein N' [Cytophagaceae bacterium]